MVPTSRECNVALTKKGVGLHTLLGIDVQDVFLRRNATLSTVL